MPRSKLSGTKTTVVVIAAVAAGGLLLYFMTQKPATPIVARPVVQPSGSAVTTAAEIAAGAGIATTLINDLTSSDSSDMSDS